MLVAVGRKPNTGGLGAAEAGVALDERGCIKTDAEWQTSVSGIYAIGDVVAGPMLAHKAEQEAVAAVERMVGQPGSVNYDAIPWVIYTAPEVAAVGPHRGRGRGEWATRLPWVFFRSKPTAGPSPAGMRTAWPRSSPTRRAGLVLGAQILSANASELIAEAVLLMELGGSAEALARTIHAHPTMSEGLREAAHAATGESLHI